MALVNVVERCSGIVLDIRYAGHNNIFGQPVYPAAASTCCFVLPEVAVALARVQERLHAAGLGLKIWDGYRPLKVQAGLWELKPDSQYVAPPHRGSNHNRGSAVDVTLVSLATGEEVRMPTDYDDFSERAHRRPELWSREEAANVNKLDSAMLSTGVFVGLRTEWWHYDLVGARGFPILDVSFEELAGWAGGPAHPPQSARR